MTGRAVRRFVKDLLRHRRTRPSRVAPDEEAQLRTAIALRAADPEGSAPREEFVAALHEQLRRELEPESAPGEAAAPHRALSPNRRRFVQVASVAAASVAAGAAGGVGVERMLTGHQSGTSVGDGTLTPNTGQWRAVAASGDLPEGAVQHFDLGTVVGFVSREPGGGLRAVSGVCTHLGCTLRLDAPSRQLNCPCHRASFAVSGEVLRQQLPITLPPLPHIQVRESAGVIEVFAPPKDA